MFQQSLVKIFSSKESVAIGWFHFKYAFLNLQDRNIKSTASKIIDCNAMVKYNIRYFACIKYYMYTHMYNMQK